MVGLNLVPNETVGYRIRPDSHNWKVERVKRHGPNSKSAGVEYSETLGYFKYLTNAAQFIFEAHARLAGSELQDEKHAQTGEIASIESLVEAFQLAKDEVTKAITQLETSLAQAGLSVLDVTKAFAAAGEGADDQAIENDGLTGAEGQ